jgi:hypothetical protein
MSFLRRMKRRYKCDGDWSSCKNQGTKLFIYQKNGQFKLAIRCVECGPDNLPEGKIEIGWNNIGRWETMIAVIEIMKS